MCHILCVCHQMPHPGEKNEYNQFHGYGKYKYEDGREYVGEWRDGRYSGKGTLTFVNGTQYIGEFVQNKKHGRGKFLYSNGEVYVGEFWSNQKSGHHEIGCCRMYCNYCIYPYSVIAIYRSIYFD